MNYKHLILALFITCPTTLVMSQQVPVSNDQYHLYGPNSHWNEFLQVGGNGRVTPYASVASTNGNLHLDSKDGAGYSIYLNHYSQGNTLLNTQAGNVGIGTYTPLSKFQVNSTNNGTGSNDWIAGNFGGTSGDRVVMGVLYGVASIGGHNNGLGAWANFAINPDGGNVGIGTTTPIERLHVLGNSIITGVIKAGSNSGTITQTASYPYSTTIETGADAGQILISAGSTQGYSSKINISGRTNGAGIQFYTRSAEVMRIADEENVGIGTSNPTAKLSVNGNIRAKEIKVEASPWPDYVYLPGHKLRTLSETEQFIKANHHLPEIPSAADVQKDGINLGEMNAKLLKKIEELTLYVIDLKRENDSQNQKILELQKSTLK